MSGLSEHADMLLPLVVLGAMLIALLVGVLAMAIDDAIRWWIGPPMPPSAEEEADDARALDSMRARLQRDSVDPLDDIVDHRGVWWGPRP